MMQWILHTRSGTPWPCFRLLFKKVTFSDKCQRLDRAFASKATAPRCHYEVLGVKRNATNEEIRDSFVSLSKQLHPDKNRSKVDSHQKMVELNVAYTILGKPATRHAYDRSLNVPPENKTHYEWAAHDAYRQSYTNFYDKMYRERQKEWERQERAWRKAEKEFREEAAKMLFRFMTIVPFLMLMPVLLLLYKGLVYGPSQTHYGGHHNCEICRQIDEEVKQLKQAEAKKRRQSRENN